MLAIRQIYSTHNSLVTIQLPESFAYYEAVEIIILPVEIPQKTRLTTQEFLVRFAGAIPNFPVIEQLELQEREVW